MDKSAIILENTMRRKAMSEGFDPLTGKGSIIDNPTHLRISDFYLPVQVVSTSMLTNKLIRKIIKRKSVASFIENDLKEIVTEELHERVCREIIKIRCRYDFCFWAYTFVRIKPKIGGEMVPFRLRHEQRKLLSAMEQMRCNSKPIRIVLLKARQWGGSTLVQLYIAWIQLVHRAGFYSTILAQTKDVSRKIKAMYSKMLENYPSWMLDIPDCESLSFSPYEGSTSDFVVTYAKGSEIARDSVTTIGTYENPDATRGGDTALVHYSEVAMWNETPSKKPEDVIRSITGGLLDLPLTVEVMESTANGTGNYFHREWLRAKSGESNRKAVFIAWYDIEHDQSDIIDIDCFVDWLVDNRESEAPSEGYADSGRYYWRLWQLGATLEGINWYRDKRKGFASHSDMASEAPSDDVEAFKHSGNKVFSLYDIDAIRSKCRKSKMLCDIYSPHGNNNNQSLEDLKLTDDGRGMLKIWSEPSKDRYSNRYITTVDIGGRSSNADYSVIAVLDRLPLSYGGVPEIVAQWRGHADHDLLAYKSAQIATYYHDALLVIESNTLESRHNGEDHSSYILNRIADIYRNLYARESSEDTINPHNSTRWGFHTNSRTKPMLIDHLVTCVRERSWIERDEKMCDELNYYERKPNGSYGAINGQHDDILMTRAIALLISDSLSTPQLITSQSYIHKRIKHLADIY